jgi:hypothetical protein
MDCLAFLCFPSGILRHFGCPCLPNSSRALSCPKLIESGPVISFNEYFGITVHTVKSCLQNLGMTDCNLVYEAEFNLVSRGELVSKLESKSVSEADTLILKL